MKQEEYESGKWLFFDQGENIKGIGRFNSEDASFCYLTELYFSDGDSIWDDWLLHESIKGLATPSQIEACLKAYAEKNGYVGAKVKLICGAIGNISEEIKYIEDRCGNVVGRNGVNSYTIYHQGQWAEIAAHAPKIQDKQDEALTESIHEYLTNQDLEKMSVLINGHSVSLLKCVEVYQLCLGIKTIIG